jgi:hypothetical protein
MVNKLEESERISNEREDDARKEQLASNEAIQQQLTEIEMMRMEQDERIKMAEIEKDILIKEMDLYAKNAELNNKDGNGSIDREKLQLDLKKLEDTLKQKKEEMRQRSEQFYASLRSQEKRTRMQLQSSEKVARMRPKATSIK